MKVQFTNGEPPRGIRNQPKGQISQKLISKENMAFFNLLFQERSYCSLSHSLCSSDSRNIKMSYEEPCTTNALDETITDPNEAKQPQFLSWLKILASSILFS